MFAFGITTLLLVMALIALVSRLYAYNPNELVSTTQAWPSRLRAIAEEIKPKTFAAGSGTIAILTPVAFNTSTNKWVVWSATDGANQVTSIPVDATGGTFTISIAFGGSTAEATGNIAFNASAATVEAALEAIGNVLPGDVAVTGGPGAAGGATPYVLTFGGRLAKTVVTVTTGVGSLTGGAGTATPANTTTASAAVGKSDIKGFLWPDPITLDSDEEVLGQVMLRGEVHYGDIVLPAGETADNLKAALRTQCRGLGIKIQGLGQVR